MTSPLVNIRTVDLNLLGVMHAVLDAGSVAGAAERLHVTPSAVSNALKRLRELLGDPLFVRDGRGLVPTSFTRSVAPTLADALGGLARVLEGPRFDALRSDRRFVLACTDARALVDVPRVAEAMVGRLPRASLRVVTRDRQTLTDGLTTGEITASIGPRGDDDPNPHHAWLYDEEIVLVVARDHPLRDPVDVPSLARLQFVEVEVTEDSPVRRMADARLSAQGLVERRVALRVPQFMAAALVVSRTDHVAGMPQRFAELACTLLPLRMVRTPFTGLSLHVALHWHACTDADPGARAFREVVLSALRA